jgi:hypothetical protein
MATLAIGGTHERFLQLSKIKDARYFTMEKN